MSILHLPPADSSPSFRTRADRHTDTHDYCMPRGSAHRGIITGRSNTMILCDCMRSVFVSANSSTKSWLQEHDHLSVQLTKSLSTIPAVLATSGRQRAATVYCPNVFAKSCPSNQHLVGRIPETDMCKTNV